MRPCLALTWSTRVLVAATLPASESSTSIPGSATLAASTERSLEPVTTTEAPSDWKSLAVSAPIPLVPQLMRAILPSSLNSGPPVPLVEALVLFSGDGDFCSLVEAVPGDVFTDLSDLQSRIGRDALDRPTPREATMHSMH